MFLFLRACKCVVFVILSSERSWEFAEERRTWESRDSTRRLTEKTASEHKFVVTHVIRKNYCVASCETKDLVWVVNFKLVWKTHIKTQLNQYHLREKPSITSSHLEYLAFRNRQHKSIVTQYFFPSPAIIRTSVLCSTLTFSSTPEPNVWLSSSFSCTSS